MKPIDRSQEPAPACLSDERTAEYRAELLRIFSADADLSSQTRVDLRSLAFVDESLDRALKSLFKDFCPFCESHIYTRAYRYRPSEEAGPADAAPPEFADRGHLYYTWLANSWSNVYAICDDCRPSLEAIFPVTGRRCPLPSADEVADYAENPTGSWKVQPKERPDLLDPCSNEDLRKHLAILTDGDIVALSARGALTIRHFHLDRRKLIQDRAHRFDEYASRLIASAEEGRVDPSLFYFDQMEFGGGWFLLLYQIAKRVGGGGGGRPTLSRKRIGAYFAERMQQPGYLRRFHQALDALRNPEALRPQQAPTRKRSAGEARPSSFTISNFKALEDIQITLGPPRMASPSLASASKASPEAPPAAPCLVILGENAAGKSSILEAMALALSEQGVRDDLAVDAGRFVLNPQWMGGQAEGLPRKGSVRVDYENGDVSEIAVANGFPFLPGPDIARVPVFAYGAFRLFLKADKRQRPSSAIRSLFEANYVLPNPEVWLVSIADKPLFFEVARALKFILAIDQEVDVIEADAKRGECSLVVTTPRPGTTPLVVRTPFSAVSSGFRAILAMACDIMRGLAAQQDRYGSSLARARAVVLIDEVEAHLHPRWKMQIIGGLRRALPEVTFIVTTHDPLCLRGLSSDEVRVFHRVQGGEKSDQGLPSYVEQLQELPAMGALTLEQLLTSDLFRLHSTDAPELDASLAMAGDLLAMERDGTLDEQRADTLLAIRRNVRDQIGKSLPIGSTEIERLVQSAVEDYLIQRRQKSSNQVETLRAATRRAIVDALGGL